jgi:ribosome biogenesis GTPase
VALRGRSPLNRIDPPLSQLGFGEPFASALAALGAPGLSAYRISSDLGAALELLGAEGQLLADLPARLRGAGRRPVVGDWVAARLLAGGRGLVEEVLQRRSSLARRAVGRAESAQVVAANVDLVLVVAALDAPLRERGLERYLALAWEGGAQPVLLLTKADLRPADEVAAAEETARALAPGAPVLSLSIREGAGVERVRALLHPGRTAVLLGPSGAGKSTLLNALAGEALQQTGAVREGDHKGRHTTTRRQLVQLPGGALLIDTPGMRELGLWAAEDGLETVFAEVAELAAGCRFTDCRHEREPGCAVLEAVEQGGLPQQRLDGYRQLRGELQHQAERTDARAREARKAGDRSATKALRAHVRSKRDG